MQHYLIDPVNLNLKTNVILDRAYLLWKSVFQNEIESRGGIFNPDCFWNARMISIIEKDDEPIGLHIYNSFDLRNLSINNHSYFNDVPKDSVDHLLNEKVFKVMTMEFLMVHPNFRGKKHAVPISELVIGLAFNVLNNSPWDIALGIARMDRKIDKAGERIGTQSAGLVTKNNTPCNIVYARKFETTPNPNPMVRDTVAQLWAKKENHSPWIKEQQPNTRKIAA